MSALLNKPLEAKRQASKGPVQNQMAVGVDILDRGDVVQVRRNLVVGQAHAGGRHHAIADPGREAAA